MSQPPGDEAPPSDRPYMAPEDLARLADNAFDMICLAADGRLTAVNRAFERILGWSAAELTSRPFFEFVHPDDIGPTTEAWLQLRRGEVLVDFENRYRHKDGGWCWIQWRAGHLDDGRVHAMARDITLQRRERVLVERTHRIARVGGWQLDFRTDELYWTQGTYRLFDVDPEAFQPDLPAALAFYAAEERDRVAAAVRGIGERGLPFDLEAPAVTATGRSIIVRAEGIPLLDDGVVVGAYGAVGDVTERRRAEELLRKMETVVRASPQPVIFVSPERTIFWYNPAAEDLLGLDDGYLGQSTSTLFTAQTFARVTQHALPQLRHQPTWQGAVEAITRDGEVIPVRVTISQYRDAQGETEFFSAMLEDLRNQRTLERQVRHSQRIESLGRLAGGLAHDFNNLLTVVMANADELTESLGQQGHLSELANEITQAARRGAELTRRLLTYARQDVARPEPVDLLQVCLELSNVLRRTLGERIQIRVEPGPQIWPVLIDPTHLDQLLMNLAMNARDAMPDGGVLTFGLSARPRRHGQPERMRLTVADTGTGMSSDVLARAMDPFFTTKERDQGTGLGLATCRGLVQQAGGTIHIESREAEGTRVIVELPRAPQPAVMPRRLAPQPAGQGTHEQLMLIEDEPGIRRVLTHGLAQMGYEVEAFETGEAAVDAVINRGFRPALIVSDVVLPGLDGPTAVRRIREELGSLPVIFASGYATEKLAQSDIEAPGTRLLRKPLTPRELAPVIRELLD